MSWVFKIDTPWGKKGAAVPINSGGYCSQFCTHLVSPHDFEKWPELFEQSSDAARTVQWLTRELSKTDVITGPRRLTRLAERLVAAGLDPDKLP